MPTPKEVFDSPLKYLDFLQSDDFERKHFDWKEMLIDTTAQVNALKSTIKKSISAFANSNRKGGLLVLGIADDGIIKGTQHVEEQTMKKIMQVMDGLKNHATQMDDIDIPDSGGKRLHFLYTPWMPNAICETVGNFPKAWKRVGAECIALTDQDREQLKRDKRIVDFEISYCCPYDPAEHDNGVVEMFKESFLKTRGAQYGHSTEDTLYHAGALIKDESNNYVFTNSGYLFFASNPRKRFGGAFVRVLHYNAFSENLENHAETIFDKDFEGPLPNIIRALREFLRYTSVFQTLSKAENNSEFIDGPEYPFIAVDEALVNAIVHREYAVTAFISCTLYKDKLVVKNPGGILLQVPQHFSLAEITLESLTRNPKLTEWMRILKDEQGAVFVRELGEGTRKMLEVMEQARLPAPYYETGSSTAVTLYNQSVAL